MKNLIFLRIFSKFLQYKLIRFVLYKLTGGGGEAHTDRLVLRGHNMCDYTLQQIYSKLPL